ncbi:terminase small subunit [Methylobacterium sp. J-001]|uniref:terminase small subunit n=1 Tax=Methylobacterium sp. J-001 TaxID=2836609 RepID=UPI001FBA2844|nr:terminase small subunit [Methylobacterium sp. J-001]MCJ2120655.1 terminase small subunit [Methylobacterium sp. J-001]
MTEVVSRNVLANQLGVSLPTVDSWVRRGCPILKPGRRGVAAQFDLRAVRGWVDRYISTGRVVRHEGQTFNLPSREQALLVKAFGHIITSHYGHAADAAHALGLSTKQIYALEYEVTLHLAKCMSDYLAEHGLTSFALDLYNKPNTEPDWRLVAAMHGENRDDEELERFFDEMHVRVVRLPRTGEA